MAHSHPEVNYIDTKLKRVRSSEREKAELASRLSCMSRKNSHLLVLKMSVSSKQGFLIKKVLIFQEIGVT